MPVFHLVDTGGAKTLRLYYFVHVLAHRVYGRNMLKGRKITIKQRKNKGDKGGTQCDRAKTL